MRPPRTPVALPALGVHRGRAWLRCTRTRAVRGAARPMRRSHCGLRWTGRGADPARHPARCAALMLFQQHVRPPAPSRCNVLQHRARRCAAVPTDAPLLRSFDNRRAPVPAGSSSTRRRSPFGGRHAATSAIPTCTPPLLPFPLARRHFGHSHLRSRDHSQHSDWASAARYWSGTSTAAAGPDDRWSARLEPTPG